jgi:hypothetical protein
VLTSQFGRRPAPPVGRAPRHQHHGPPPRSSSSSSASTIFTTTLRELVETHRHLASVARAPLVQNSSLVPCSTWNLSHRTGSPPITCVSSARDPAHWRRVLPDVLEDVATAQFKKPAPPYLSPPKIVGTRIAGITGLAEDPGPTCCARRSSPEPIDVRPRTHASASTNENTPSRACGRHESARVHLPSRASSRASRRWRPWMHCEPLAQTPSGGPRGPVEVVPRAPVATPYLASATVRDHVAPRRDLQEHPRVLLAQFRDHAARVRQRPTAIATAFRERGRLELRRRFLAPRGNTGCRSRATLPPSSASQATPEPQRRQCHQSPPALTTPAHRGQLPWTHVKVRRSPRPDTRWSRGSPRAGRGRTSSTVPLCPAVVRWTS